MRNVEQQIATEISRLTFIGQRTVELSANRVVRGTRIFSGQAKMNTRIGINTVDTRVSLVRPYVRGAVADADQRQSVIFKRESKKVRLGDTAHISNNLDYIQSLETEKGDLMFRKAIFNFPKDVSQAVSEARRIF